MSWHATPPRYMRHRLLATRLSGHIFREITHLIDHGGLEIEEHAAGHVLAGARLREEGVEGVVTAAHGLVGRHLAIGLNAVLEAVELPAGVTHLRTTCRLNVSSPRLGI